MSTKYFVKTTLGNSIIDLSTNLLVAIDNNRFVRKKAFDLNEGNRVFYENQSINTTLNEVIPVLERSLRYAHARNVLFERNRDGEYVPRMRTNLLRSLCPRFGMELNEDLENVILKNSGPDFNPGLKDEMAEHTRDIISRYMEPEHVDTIRSWIDARENRPHCPRRWQTYEALAEINPIFRQYYESQDIPGRFHYNYKLYVTTHQRIMDYLTRRTNTRTQENGENINIARPGYRFSLKEEIELVVNEFMHEINDEFSLAQIISIDKLKQSEANKRERANPHLRRGIVSMANSPEVREIDIRELLLERFVIDSITNMMSHSYYESISCFDDYELTSYKGKNIDEQYGSYLRKRVMMAQIHKELISDIMYGEHANLGEVANSIVKKTKDDIISGNFDSITGQKKGTFLHFQEIKKDIHNAVPRMQRDIDKDLYHVNEMMHLLGKSEREIDEARDNVHRRRKRIIAEYGYDPFELNLTILIALEQMMSDGVTSGTYEFIGKKYEDLIKDETVRKRIRENEKHLITKEQAREVLGRYNLRELAEPYEYLFV